MAMRGLNNQNREQSFDRHSDSSMSMNTTTAAGAGAAGSGQMDLSSLKLKTGKLLQLTTQKGFNQLQIRED